MRIAGSKELMEQVRDRDLCSVCGGCVGICPYHQDYKGKIAMTFACDIQQGQCYAYCPKTESDLEGLSQMLFGAPYRERPLGSYREIAAARAGSRVEVGAFQNGGAVSALMIAALEKGWIDAAVVTGGSGIIPEPGLAENREEVLACKTTKYAATPTLAALNRSVREGRKNLGVVGTGCQMKAVAAMRANPLDRKEYQNAVSFSLGLFCTWALDLRKFIRFITDLMDPEEILGMDVPPPPAEQFILKTADGETSLPLSDIRPLISKACSFCPDMTAEWADVSVGAFEGKAGWNTLVIRSEMGQKWVQSATEEGYLELGEFPAASLDHLSLGAENKRKRAGEIMEKEK